MLNFCIEKGVLLDKQVSEIFENLGDLEFVKKLIERIQYEYKQKIITKSFFTKNVEKVNELFSKNNFNKEVAESFFINLGLNIEIGFKKNIKSGLENGESDLNKNVSLIKICENIPKKIEVKNFVNNFRNRFNFIREILRNRIELDNLISINRIEENKQISVIGMVYDKRVTKNGNVLLEIEDLTGKITALVNKDRKEVFEKSKEILLDEVVGLKCSGNREIIFVNDIIFPDIQLIEKKKSKHEEYAAFISDLHVGSNKFLEANFLKFIDWLNGNVGDEEQKKQALKVKYVFITGDSIDGVGIFPGQEKELAIKDVREQYKKLSELLLKIREDVQMILCPGQHDAVRVAEPQPALSETYAEPLYYLKNLKLVTNPSIIEIGSDVKFKILMYHGASMHGIVNSIDALRFGKAHDSPTEVVKYMLKKRHLAPTHSLVTYTPCDNEDSLLIHEAPDILATGDLHRPEVAEHNNVLLVASSCWQSKTPFEEKVGNNPDPCKVPIFNLKTRQVKILDFSEGCEEDVCEENKVNGEGDDN